MVCVQVCRYNGLSTIVPVMSMLVLSQLLSIGRRQRRGEAVQEDIPARDFLAMTKMGAGQLFQAVLEGRTVSSALVLMSDKGAYYQSAGTSSEGMACGASHFLVCEIARILQTEEKNI